jgi:hypothetical protein
MKVSGFSHAMASIVTMVVGAAITEYLKKYFPSIFRFLERVGRWISYFIFNKTNINIPPFYFVPFFVIFTLAFFWGMLYHFIRHGRKKE